MRYTDLRKAEDCPAFYENQYGYRMCMFADPAACIFDMAEHDGVNLPAVDIERCVDDVQEWLLSQWWRLLQK